MQIQLKPLTVHLNIRIKYLEVPEYGALQARGYASVFARASNSDPNAIDTILNGQSELMPSQFLGDIKVPLKTYIVYTHVCIYLLYHIELNGLFLHCIETKINHCVKCH